MSKPTAFRTTECTTSHADRSRARMYRGECSRCTGLIALLYRDARGRVVSLRTTVRQAARKARTRRLPTVFAEQLVLF
jgi:hypothetical protein